MKAITLWQPWASLIACGAKKYETRSWATRYRGPIAIHAAAVNPFKVIRGLDDTTIAAMKNILRSSGALPQQGDFRYLPLGAVVATAELVDCHPIFDDGSGWLYSAYLQRPNRPQEYIHGYELEFGDWTPGRYAWELVNVQMLAEPIPVKGKQGLWNWERGSN